MSWFKELSSIAEKVQSAMPVIDESMLEKLTLTTPELTAERMKLDEEEKRKEKARDILAGMLPWETHDPERDILVEECKEAILQLSSKKETFFGPYVMPHFDAKTGKDGEDAEDDEHVDKKHMPPSKESLEQLAKLEPLPPLLQHFDFNAHVGLIGKMLEADPKLVEMQSNLSGGGEREKVFWRNYFFHCAFTRYEAGLSIDEIWSDTPLEERVAAAEREATSANEKEEEEEDGEAEETIEFDDSPDAAETEESAPSTTTPIADEALFTEDESSKPSTNFSESSEYEMVGESGGGSKGGDDEGDGGKTDAAAGGDDYELDELEAEILRELED